MLKCKLCIRPSVYSRQIDRIGISALSNFPPYYVWSGFIFLYYASINRLGETGNVWGESASLEQSSNAIHLGFDMEKLYVLGLDNRNLAFPVWHDFSNSHSCESLKMYKQG